MYTFTVLCVYTTMCVCVCVFVYTDIYGYDIHLLIDNVTIYSIQCLCGVWLQICE